MLEAAVYYETQVAQLGEIFLAKVESAVRDIASRPTAWPILRNNIRKHLIHRFPYALLYHEETDEIVIVAVMHQRRRPNYWLGRI